LGSSFFKLRRDRINDYYKPIIKHGYLECPLCLKYNNVANSFSCSGCPIKAKAGDIGCRCTPYIAWHHFTERFGDSAYCTNVDENMIKAHLAMIKWMKELYKELKVV
jgi:hypothetical protein